MKRYHESRIWFEASLALAEKMSGKTSVSTGTLLFQLAQAQVLDRDHHGAVKRMQECCNIFRSTLGPLDRNTKEAEQWLEQLTQNAVSMAKRQKDIASGKIKVPKYSAGRMAARPQPSVGQNAVESSVKSGNVKQKDTRTIEELVRYIDGDKGERKATQKKKGSSNPKARRVSVKAS
jgi:protein TIF31